jgi:hypothetical protein
LPPRAPAGTVAPVAAATIKISQTGLTATPAGQARRDVAVGVPVTLRNGDDSGVTTWRWVLLYRPPGSSATIANPNSAVATITPDVDGGTYRIQLSINGAREALGEVQTRVFRVPDAAGLAAPAANERGDEANYVVDAVTNTWGWADEYNRRYLASVDTRTDPEVVAIANGASYTIAIPWGLHDAVLQILEVGSSVSASIDITIAADAGFANKLLLVAAVDPSAVYKVYEHRTLSWPSTGLTGTIYLKITNNDVNDNFRIAYRLGAL